jgi:hypothetical protein
MDSKINNLSNLLVVVLASYNLPVYKDMIEIRRIQFKQFGLPVYFIIDGPINGHKLLPDEIYIERTKDIENGTTIQKEISNILFKFHESVNELLKKHINVTHVLRLNVSTYVNLDKLNVIFPSIPFRDVIYGTQILKTGTLKSMFPKGFLSGTAILYSKDVMEYFCKIDIKNEPISYLMPDDVALAKLLEKYNSKEFFNIYHFKINIPNISHVTHYNTYINDYYKKTILETNSKHLKDYTFIRVRNDKDRDIIDKQIWIFLYNYFTNSESNKTKTNMEQIEHFNSLNNTYNETLIFYLLLFILFINVFNYIIENKFFSITTIYK